MEDALDQSWRRLEQAWQETSQDWQDAKQAEFATRHWTPIEAETDVYRGVLRDLETVLANARQHVH